MNKPWAAVIFTLAFVASVVGCGGSDDAADVDASASDADPSAPDADPDAPDADPNAPDAGDESVSCGNTSCSAGTECCVRDGEPRCVDSGSCEGDVIACQGPDDCPDEQICCRGAGAATQCTAAAQCASFICEEDEDCPGANQECCVGEFSSTCALSCDDDD